MVLYIQRGRPPLSATARRVGNRPFLASIPDNVYKGCTPVMQDKRCYTSNIGDLRISAWARRVENGLFVAATPDNVYIRLRIHLKRFLFVLCLCFVLYPFRLTKPIDNEVHDN